MMIPDATIAIELFKWAGLGAVAMFAYKFGGKMDRLSSSIEHLAKVMDNHEERLGVLEKERLGVA